MKKTIFLTGLLALLLQVNCSSSDNTSAEPTPGETGPTDIEHWLTTSSQASLLAKQTTPLNFSSETNIHGTVTVDASQAFQTMDGFGYTLTGGSVQVINNLSASKKQELLQDLFGTGGIRVNYLRLSIGASDLNATPFTYNDLPAGQTDMDLSEFSLSNDQAVITMLNEIKAINPSIKLIATPWSAPVWMKDNDSFIGGSLRPEYYQVYADYFVKYIQQMQAAGIAIDAITPQNEPENPHNNPSMLMTSSQQRDFIKNNLGPAFQTNGITTKIVIFDHNCDHPNYPIEILNDPAAKAFIDGSAFHLYAGNISAMTSVHNAHPDKNVYFTEQYTASSGSFAGDLRWHVKNVLAGSARNWSKLVMEWNLANDSGFGPHTDGGCTVCKGAITINDTNSYSKNVAYYVIAHASKFVPAGSVRIASNEVGSLSTVAFKTPENKIVLVAVNDSDQSLLFNIKYNNRQVSTSLAGGSVATYVWNQ